MDDLFSSFLDFLFGGVIGLAGWFFGGRDGYLMVLLALVCIDYFTGLCAAWSEHTLSSEAGFNGILRKCVMFSLVGVAHLMDTFLPGNPDTFRTAVCLFYIGNEGVSILENANSLGVPFPEYFKQHFFAMKDKKNDSH